MSADARGWMRIDENTPHDRRLLLFWPSYAYNLEEKGEKYTAIGRWKTNSRLQSHYPNGDHKLNPEMMEFVRDRRISDSYFADTGEQDDCGLAQPEHAPTYWQEVPEQPMEYDDVR